jgi:C1A family cysteine protease
MSAHRRSPRPILPLVALLVGGGCAPTAEPTPTDVPLGSTTQLFGGLPSGASLPHDDKADMVFPAQFTDLVSFNTPARDQAFRGVCAIFASVGAAESHLLQDGQLNPDLSEQFLQWSVFNEVHAPVTDGGTSATYTFDALHRFGVPAESAWPYEPKPWTTSDNFLCNGNNPMPVACYTNGDPPNKARNAARIIIPAGSDLRTESIKAHLHEKRGVVVVALPVYFQAWNHPRSSLPISSSRFGTGIVGYPNPKDISKSAPEAAAHAVVVIGWDDTLEFPYIDEKGKEVKDASGQPKMERGFYLFKNSWGQDGFGKQNPLGKGFGYLSMRYAHEFGAVHGVPAPGIAPDPDEPGLNGLGMVGNWSIPKGGSVSKAIDGGGFTGATAGGARLEIEITHPDPRELQIDLDHDGHRETLLAAGTGDASLFDRTLHTDAFSAEPQSGTWTVIVSDGPDGDTGVLRSFTLGFVAPPTP